MSNLSHQTAQLQSCVERLQTGDESARTELINCACERLTRLTRKMFRGFARVRRWEETDDVVQNAAMGLFVTLADIRPTSVVDFFRLAALNIRRELLDLGAVAPFPAIMRPF
jgi:RNA polymerase sigma-70 factor (ECF subfamily)